MPLTSLLDLPQSGVRGWIHERFPLVREAARAATWEAAGAEAVLAPDGASEGVLGMAFDYRLRAWVAPYDARGTAALVGAMGIGAVRRIVGPRAHSCSRSCREPHVDARTRISEDAVMRLVFEATEAIARGRDVGDERLARVCVLLAVLEAAYRSGNRPTEILVPRHRARTVDELLLLVPRAWADDGVRLLRLAAARLPALEAPVLNPSFAGSPDVGGADADLADAGTLWDLKARARPLVPAADLYQLLGYVLLDYDDALALRRVGVYLARHGAAFSWALDELAGRPVGGADLGRMRGDFARFLASGGALEPRPLPPLAPRRRPGGPAPTVRRTPSPEAEAYWAARKGAAGAWDAARAAAAAYRRASRPTLVYWRRDPAVLGPRLEAAALAADALRAAVAAAREADEACLAAEAALWGTGPHRSPARPHPSNGDGVGPGGPQQSRG